MSTRMFFIFSLSKIVEANYWSGNFERVATYGWIGYIRRLRQIRKQQEREQRERIESYMEGLKNLK